MFPIPSGLRVGNLSLYTSKIVDEKEVLYAFSNACIYCSRDKVGTVYLV
jgi:hypothetical protein